ncbi:MAG: crotonase/enoyl-CoA hydratase family protein [Gammaproteobacteria bacterium]|nr:crotonase/enoyl-CoA hydratase family protein [Gammaproteobacteria bacterium]
MNRQPLTQLKTHYDIKNRTGWFFMNARPRPCFTSQLLSDINNYQCNVKAEMLASQNKKYDYIVLASAIKNIFNFGGDLALFHTLIQQENSEDLLAYATQCINVLYQNMIHLGSELTTISLVQGDALGGGFEAALSSNILIAERGTKMGLPEVLFNLFPGMGAYSLLARKLNSSQAEKIILSGRLYSAEELHEMGIVDILAETGEGKIAVQRYIKTSRHSQNSHNAIRKIRDSYNTITYDELLRITEIWVEAALNLSAKDLRMIQRLVTRQDSKTCLL